MSQSVNSKFKEILIIGSLVLMLSAFAQAQEEQKLIDWYPVDRPMNLQAQGLGVFFTGSDIKALEIVEVKVADKPISIGKPFTANEDWIKSLSVRVKNISAKPIVSIRFNFDVPEARQPNQNHLGLNLTYGQKLATDMRKVALANQDKLIMPGEEIELKLPEISYNSWLEFMKKRSGMTSFKTLQIAMTSVAFENDLFWESNRLPLAGQK